MARRNKRASMREGPLADLFRSTTRPDEPAEEPPPPASDPPTEDFDSMSQRDYETEVLSAEDEALEPEPAEHAIFDIEDEVPEPPPTRIAERPAADPAALDPPERDDVSVYRPEAETRVVSTPEEPRTEPRERLNRIF